MFCDGQSEPRASRFSRTGHVHSVKALKNPRLLRSGNADACVCHCEHNFITLGVRAQNNLSACQRVLNGVIQQILQHFGDSAAISGNFRYVCQRFDRHIQVFLRCPVVRGFYAALNQLLHADAMNFELEPFGVHLREH
jgi:hypothetical protein